MLSATLQQLAPAKLRFCSNSGQFIVGRGQNISNPVSVTMDDLPLAVFAAIDMRHAQAIRLERNANPRGRGMFVADCIGQIPADAGGDELEAVGGAVGVSRPEPAEDLAHLIPAPRGPCGAEQSHGVARRPHRHAWRRVAIVERFLRRDLPRKSGCEEVVEFANGISPIAQWGQTLEAAMLNYLTGSLVGVVGTSGATPSSCPHNERPRGQSEDQRERHHEDRQRKRRLVRHQEDNT
jgi:hypothetical protein